jgi:hypothetical protein
MKSACGMYRREKRSAYRDRVGKVEEKRPLGRPRPRWEDNIKVNLKEVGCGHIKDWPGSGYRHRWRAFVNAVMKLRVP